MDFRMSEGFLDKAMRWMEAGKVPDGIVRLGIRKLLKDRLRDSSIGGASAQEERLQLLREHARNSNVAVFPEKANEQHYEVPAEFFHRVLGARLKYSCCHWGDGVNSLDAAEEQALAITAARADLQDGQRILELGCGWGSLTLWMAEHFPKSPITAVSNSHGQRQYIETAAKERGFHNLRIITADMNDFRPEEQFDRVVSVEMFEHMRNHSELMRRIHDWLNPQGRLFVHIFCHRKLAYLFETEGAANWMGRHFFSGGMMPSAEWLLTFPQPLALVERWFWNGRHYEKTSNAWLAKMDAQAKTLMPLFEKTYQAEANRWFMRWRIFFMACAELFGYAGGEEWLVAHYLFEKT
jgi:cyclopropane-fatty-acyl-phospholipid synthase